MDTADGKAEKSELQKAANEITDALTGRELDLVHGGVGHERWTECLAGHGGRLPHMETTETGQQWFADWAHYTGAGKDAGTVGAAAPPPNFKTVGAPPAFIGQPTLMHAISTQPSLRGRSVPQKMTATELDSFGGGGVNLTGSACRVKPVKISGMARPITTKFGVSLQTTY